MSDLVVKMMSGEDLPDSNTSKSFIIVEAYGEVRCERDANGKPMIVIPLECGQLAIYHPEGNTYVLKNGKTVATFTECAVTTLRKLKEIVPLEKLKEMAANNSELASYYMADPLATWVMEQDHISKPVADGAILIIYNGVITTEVTSRLNKLGYEEVGAFINIDASSGFKVYCANLLKPQDFDTKAIRTLKRDFIFDIKSVDTLEKLARLKYHEYPTFIEIPDSLRGRTMSSDAELLLKNYTMGVVGFTSGSKRSMLMELKPKIESQLNKSHYNLLTIDSVAVLADLFDVVRLGPSNPIIKISIPEEDLSSGAEKYRKLLLRLADCGYNGRTDGTWYYSRLSSTMAAGRLLKNDMEIINSFKSGIPHSLILDDVLVQEGGIIASLISLYGYKFSKVVRLNGFINRLAVEYTIPYAGRDIPQENIDPDAHPTFIGMVNTQDDLKTLVRIPTKYRPKHIEVSELIAYDYPDLSSVMKTYQKSKHGYILNNGPTHTTE